MNRVLRRRGGLENGRGARVAGALRLGLALALGTALLSTLLVPAKAAPSHHPGHPDYAAIDYYLQQEVDALNIPGLALAIVQGDEVVHLAGFGVADPSGRPVTPQTPFSMASMSKSLTAMAVMQLVEAGQIELDAPVQRYLPWFRVADAEGSAKITVRDLLYHTSGLPQWAGNDYRDTDETGAGALEARVRALGSVPLNRPVGSSFEYCNANYDTLGLIVQVVSGEDYDTYVRSHIFEPLQMQHAYSDPTLARQDGLATGYRQFFGAPIAYDAPHPRAFRPSGYLMASAEDVAHYLVASLNEGRYEDRAVLSPTGMALMQPESPEAGPAARRGMHWGYRVVSDVPVMMLQGDNAHYAARAMMSPDEGWGVVLLMNTNHPGINGGRAAAIKDGVVRLLRDQAPAPAAQATSPMITIALVAAPLGTALLVGSGLWRVSRLRGRDPEARPRPGWRLWAGLVVDLLWAAVLLFGFTLPVSHLSKQPILFMLRTTPDLGWLIVICAALTVIAGLVRTVLSYRLITASRPSVRGEPRRVSVA